MARNQVGSAHRQTTMDHKTASWRQAVALLLSSLLVALLATSCQTSQRGPEAVSVAQPTAVEPTTGPTVVPTDTPTTPPTADERILVESIAPVRTLAHGDSARNDIEVANGRVIRSEEVRAEAVLRLGDAPWLEAVDLTTSFVFVARTDHGCRAELDPVWLDIFETEFEIRLDLSGVAPEDDLILCAEAYTGLNFFVVDNAHAPLFADSLDDLFTRIEVFETLTPNLVDSDFLFGITEPTLIETEADELTLVTAVSDGVLAASIYNRTKHSSFLLWPGEVCAPALISPVLVLDQPARVDLGDLDQQPDCAAPNPFVAIFRISSSGLAEELAATAPDTLRVGLSDPAVVLRPEWATATWSAAAVPRDFAQLRPHLITSVETYESTAAQFADDDIGFDLVDFDANFVLFVPAIHCLSRFELRVVLVDDVPTFVPALPDSVDCDDPTYIVRSFVVDRTHLPIFGHFPEGLA